MQLLSHARILIYYHVRVTACTRMLLNVSGNLLVSCLARKSQTVSIWCVREDLWFELCSSSQVLVTELETLLGPGP